VGSGVDWGYWLFFTITVDCNSSHVELLLNDLRLADPYEESLTTVRISEWSLVSRILYLDLWSLELYYSYNCKAYPVEQLIVIGCAVGCPGNLVLITCCLVTTRSLLSISVYLAVAHQRTSGSGPTIPAFRLLVTLCIYFYVLQFSDTRTYKELTSSGT
jgi:hypothetical protein